MRKCELVNSTFDQGYGTRTARVPKASFSPFSAQPSAFGSRLYLTQRFGGHADQVNIRVRRYRAKTVGDALAAQ
jgi:hypothetical protein